jgi:hypothetical protein
LKGEERRYVGKLSGETSWKVKTEFEEVTFKGKLMLET